MIAPVQSGLDVLVDDAFAPLRGRRIGLIANQSSVDRRLRHAIDLLHAADSVELLRLFGPEHGLRGEAQDMIGVASTADRRTGLPIVSLYGDRVESLRLRTEDLGGLDALVFDVQDVGSRYYTFAATMFFAMDAAAEAGVSMVVLDRPNPLGGEVVEGPTVEPGFESFVGAYPLPIRHGMTVGELARLYREERGLDLDLEVVACRGLARSTLWHETGLPWVMPSPNMPTPETTLVYPGGCLIEGTNLSEGRGTTRPFELWGAPWLEEAADRLAAEVDWLDGALFRAAAFRPVFHKHAGRTCYGVQPFVTDPRTFSGLTTHLVLLAGALRADPERFAWRIEPYEFVSEPIAIDLLFGSSRPREALEAIAGEPRVDLRDWSAGLLDEWRPEAERFVERSRSARIYS